MRRYFYQTNSLASKWFSQNINAHRFEDEVYLSAFLSALRIDKSQSYDILHEKILDMTISEQQKYANNTHIELLFRHFKALHHQSKDKPYINQRLDTQVKDIIDPNLFVIWDLKQSKKFYNTRWPFLMGYLRYQLGFQMTLKESLVQHPAAGLGVKIVLSKHKQQINVGQFLGFIPGKIYYSYEDYKKSRLLPLKTYERIPEHLYFPSGKVLELGKINKNTTISQLDQMQQLSELVDPSFINPYALGQFINHPPPNEQPNVCFLEIELQKRFYPNYMEQFYPYNNHINQKVIICFGIFALKPIANNSELFVNYNESHIYPISDIPQWLLEPTYRSQIFQFHKKKQYETPSRIYLKFLEKQALGQNRKLYQQYLQNKIKIKPQQLVHEDAQTKIIKMSVRQQKKLQ